MSSKSPSSELDPLIGVGVLPRRGKVLYYLILVSLLVVFVVQGYLNTLYGMVIFHPNLVQPLIESIDCERSLQLAPSLSQSNTDTNTNTTSEEAYQLTSTLKKNKSFYSFYEYWKKRQRPPPALYLTSVWVTRSSDPNDNSNNNNNSGGGIDEVIFRAVRHSLDTISARLSEYSLSTSAEESRPLRRLLQLAHPISAAQTDVMTKKTKVATEEVNSTTEEEKTTTITTLKPFLSEKDAFRFFSVHAQEQQLIRPTLSHTFSEGRSKEKEVFTISLLSSYRAPTPGNYSQGTAAPLQYLPRSLFPFLSSSSDSLWCSIMNTVTKAAFCVVFEETLLAPNTTRLEQSVEAALASLLAQFLHVKHFKRLPSSASRDTNVVLKDLLQHPLAVREGSRQYHACLYAKQSLQILHRNLQDHPDLRIIDDAEVAFRRLEALVQTPSSSRQGKRDRVLLVERDYVAIAKAADDVQLHPLLSSQLAIPDDQRYITHTTILLPFLISVMLGVRFFLEERKKERVERKKIKKD